MGTNEELNEELKPCPKCGSTVVRYFYYDDEVSVCCRHCQFETAPHRLEKFAASDWNAIPRCALQWTEELPTEEGWYWWCGDTRCIPTIGRIGYQGSRAEGLFTMPPLGTGVESVPISAVGGFWAGPIPEPQEVRK